MHSPDLMPRGGGSRHISLVRRQTSAAPWSGTIWEATVNPTHTHKSAEAGRQSKTDFPPPDAPDAWMECAPSPGPGFRRKRGRDACNGGHARLLWNQYCRSGAKSGKCSLPYVAGVAGSLIDGIAAQTCGALGAPSFLPLSKTWAGKDCRTKVHRPT